MSAVLGSRQRNGIPGQVRHTLGQHCPGHCSSEILTNVLERKILLRKSKKIVFSGQETTPYIVTDWCLLS
jgi:hypothetical protein